MTWYVYKCNNRNEPHQNHYGHWRDFFDDAAAGNPRSWGTNSVVPALSILEDGDRILAYQTDDNSLMGLLEVDGWRNEDGHDYVYLRPLLRLGIDGVKVRPMKSDPIIDDIHAFKTRQVKTLYDITPGDAEYILDAARALCTPIDFQPRKKKLPPKKAARNKMLDRSRD